MDVISDDKITPKNTEAIVIRLRLEFLHKFRQAIFMLLIIFKIFKLEVHLLF